MEQAIVKGEDNRYYFWDDPEWGSDINREDAVAVLDSADAIGGHLCHHSQLYEADALEQDGLQWELLLPDGIYIVTYYRYAPESGGDLTQEVDWHITDKELIRNVIEHKYVEGATYYLVEEKGE